MNHPVAAYSCCADSAASEPNVRVRVRRASQPDCLACRRLFASGDYSLSGKHELRRWCPRRSCTADGRSNKPKDGQMPNEESWIVDGAPYGASRAMQNQQFG